MAKYQLECLYCGHKWFIVRHFPPGEERCLKCDDKHVRARDFTGGNKFGYEEEADEPPTGSHDPYSFD